MRGGKRVLESWGPGFTFSLGSVDLHALVTSPGFSFRVCKVGLLLMMAGMPGALGETRQVSWCIGFYGSYI